MVIDPPRKGCDADFREQLLAYAPARLVYVSCDPATQARDIKAFIAGGYRITRIQPFDLFPIPGILRMWSVFHARLRIWKLQIGLTQAAQ